MRILLVEDDPAISALIERELLEHQYAVDIARDGVTAEELALSNDYDLVVLDLMLPRRDGREVCEAIRREGSEVPILMLTALGAEEEEIRGLDLGADDYLVKPVSTGVLLAHIRSLIRRRSEAKQAIVRAADLELDTARRTVTRHGRTVALSTKEFQLLEYFLLNRGRVLTRDMISEHVWDMHFDPRSNVIDSLVRMLRMKIDRHEARPLIQTVRGAGYRFTEAE